MKKKVILLLSILLSSQLFMGCASQPQEEVTECYVTLEDGENSTYCPVHAYGDEFTFPEGDKNAEGTFAGWVGMDGLHQPGEKIVSQEFMTFTAVYTSPDAGTILALNSQRGGHFSMNSNEAMELPSPYEDYEGESHDDFFDVWQDQQGNTYEGGQSVKVENGDILILKAIYSTDYSKAYKVDVHLNVDSEELDYYRYVKKGYSIPLVVSYVPQDWKFEGWFDSKTGGKRIANEDESFSPTKDISIYAHWKQE